MKNGVSWTVSPVKTKKAKKCYSLPAVATQEATGFWKEPPSLFTESSDTFDDFSSVQVTTSDSHSFMITSVDRKNDHLVLYSSTRKVRVEGSWREINFQVGQRINVFSCPCCTHEGVLDDCILLDDDHNLLTIESDIISVTTFVRAFRCTNLVFFGQKVLDLNLKYQDPSAVVGSIVHSLVEIAVKESNFGLVFLVQKLRALVRDNIRLIYMSNSTEKKTINECMKHLKHILKMRIKNSETEKKLISFMLNLKGKVDVVTDMELIEIKTGRPVATHRAQLILYSMMHREPKSLKLFYTGTGEWVNVDLRHNEVRSIILMRNFLNLKVCKCSTYCSLMQKMDLFCKAYWDALEKEEQNRMEKLFEVFYVSQTDDVLVVEYLGYNHNHEQQHNFQKTASVEQHTHIPDAIKCIGYVENSTNGVYTHIFTKNKIHLCRGRVVKAIGKRITIQLLDNTKLDTQTSLLLSVEYSDILYKSMRYALLNCYSTYQKLLEYFGDPRHFLNKLVENEGLSPEIKILDSLYSTDTPGFSKESPKTNKIETQPIWESQSKEFGSYVSRYTTHRSRFRIPEALRNDFLSLNELQKSSLFLSLNTTFFHLVHGMPGSGKTGVVTLLIRILNYYEQSVLVVSYTNLSLNNIVKRLGLRVYTANRGAVDRKIGEVGRNSADAKSSPFTLESENKPCKPSEFTSVDDMKKQLEDVKIVTATCFSFSDPVFINRTFDFLVIDEGSQIHFPLGLLPISLCRRFVVFGDHLQLKPLVFSEKALSLSLFRGLMDENKSDLRVQYRMGSDIMRLSNILFYENKMISGVDYKGSVCYIDTGLPMYSDGLEALFRTIDEDIIVLCYFNAQVSYLRQITKNIVETIDRYQGSEADRVIVVFDPVTDCSVMRSRERLNVALTRARKSLLLVGNRRKMVDVPVFVQLLGLL